MHRTSLSLFPPTLSCFLIFLLSLLLSLFLPFFAISSLSTDYAFVNLQCKHSLLAHSLLIYSPSVHTGPISCSLSLGWAEPQGQLGASMPTGIPIMLPKARPW